VGVVSNLGEGACFYLEVRRGRGGGRGRVWVRWAVAPSPHTQAVAPPPRACRVSHHGCSHTLPPRVCRVSRHAPTTPPPPPISQLPLHVLTPADAGSEVDARSITRFDVTSTSQSQTNSGGGGTGLMGGVRKGGSGSTGTGSQGTATVAGPERDGAPAPGLKPAGSSSTIGVAVSAVGGAAAGRPAEMIPTTTTVVHDLGASGSGSSGGVARGGAGGGDEGGRAGGMAVTFAALPLGAGAANAAGGVGGGGGTLDLGRGAGSAPGSTGRAVVTARSNSVHLGDSAVETSVEEASGGGGARGGAGVGEGVVERAIPVVSSLRFLVVDDVGANRKFLIKAIAKQMPRAQFEEAEDGTDAVTAVARDPTRFQVRGAGGVGRGGGDGCMVVALQHDNGCADGATRLLARPGHRGGTGGAAAG
jgi:hypothetical protein